MQSTTLTKLGSGGQTQTLWNDYYARGLVKGWTFRQAEAAFNREQEFRLPHIGLAKLPVRELDWARRIYDVPVSRLS